MNCDPLVLICRIHDLDAERPLGMIPSRDRVVQVLKKAQRGKRRWMRAGHRGGGYGSSLHQRDINL